MITMYNKYKHIFLLDCNKKYKKYFITINKNECRLLPIWKELWVYYRNISYLRPTNFQTIK
jgi:hypothetical protein